MDHVHARATRRSRPELPPRRLSCPRPSAARTTVGPGDVVGELSLIDGKPTSASVEADTPIEAIVIDRSKFTTLLESTPQLCPRLMVGLATRRRAADPRADVLGYGSPERRPDGRLRRDRRGAGRMTSCRHRHPCHHRHRPPPI
ncbi:Crp/Fnr family transcriptional regulator [Ilumatobacter sp.]|uniref:Crp/Fnr family transcriptional regulator n=1 Tax=Ilumatobacter sp. TaxID=1967498 RepID=UPI003C6EB278